MSREKPETIIIKDAIRRFSHLPVLTIAKHVLATDGVKFDNNLETIRNRIRYFTGCFGEEKLAKLGDTSLLRPNFDWRANMPATWRKTRTEYKLSPGLWLVLSDIHVPFHEPKAIEAAVQYGKDAGVTGILINGDLMDCASVSFWPTAKRDMNGELGAVIDFLDWLRAEFSGIPIIWKPGNHEYRLPRTFMDKLPQLAETPYASFESVLGLEQRGIEFLDYYQIVRAGELPIIHGHEIPMINRAVNPARGLFMRSKTFSACSHCHTTSEHTSKTINGLLLTCWSFACLCDLSPDYNPFGNDWNWGFPLINVEKSGHFEVENKRILPNGRVV